MTATSDTDGTAAGRAGMGLADFGQGLDRATKAFLDAIHERTPQGHWIEVKHHPNGDWSVAHQHTGHDHQDGYLRGLLDAANICASAAETTYDDADGFEAATGCELMIRQRANVHKTMLKREKAK